MQISVIYEITCIATNQVNKQSQNSEESWQQHKISPPLPMRQDATHHTPVKSVPELYTSAEATTEEDKQSQSAIQSYDMESLGNPSTGV